MVIKCCALCTQIIAMHVQRIVNLLNRAYSVELILQCKPFSLKKIHSILNCLTKYSSCSGKKHILSYINISAVVFVFDQRMHFFFKGLHFEQYAANCSLQWLYTTPMIIVCTMLLKDVRRSSVGHKNEIKSKYFQI